MAGHLNLVICAILFGIAAVCSKPQMNPQNDQQGTGNGSTNGLVFRWSAESSARSNDDGAATCDASTSDGHVGGARSVSTESDSGEATWPNTRTLLSRLLEKRVQDYRKFLATQKSQNPRHMSYVRSFRGFLMLALENSDNDSVMKMIRWLRDDNAAK